MNIVISNDAKTIAGGENYVLYLAKGLRDKGHNITIASLLNSDLSETVKSLGYNLIEVPYGQSGKEFNAVRILYNHLKKNKIDIVHSNGNSDRTIAAFAGKLVKAVNFSTIHLCMSINRNLTHSFRNKYLINHFTPVGEATKKILISHDGIPAEKISVVNIGLPENKFLFNPQLRKKIREEFNIPEDSIVIGTVSRLVEFKGHIFLMKAFAELLKSYPGLRLLIIGDGPLKEDLISKSKQLQIDQKTIFTGARNDISGILSAMDIFAQPSMDFGGESFPVSILEAMSIGLPIIASNVGDIGKMIGDTNGVLTIPENVDEIVGGLNSLLNTKDVIKKYGENSRQIFLKNFTISKMIDEMEELYLMRLGRSD
jgi:glycosyltransferase involved in cell wall biosynthesis